jgi:hypothetical protein
LPHLKQPFREAWNAILSVLSEPPSAWLGLRAQIRPLTSSTTLRNPPRRRSRCECRERGMKGTGTRQLRTAARHSRDALVTRPRAAAMTTLLARRHASPALARGFFTLPDLSALAPGLPTPPSGGSGKREDGAVTYHERKILPCVDRCLLVWLVLRDGAFCRAGSREGNSSTLSRTCGPTPPSCRIARRPESSLRHAR